MHRTGCVRVVLVVTHLDEAALLIGAEAGACGFLRRGDASPERLAAVVLSAAAGDGAVPSDLIGQLLLRVQRLNGAPSAAEGFGLPRLTEREVAVLRLLAEGQETAEIARHRCYSERTVKGIIHEITSRLHLRNRSHLFTFHRGCATGSKRACSMRTSRQLKPHVLGKPRDGANT